MTVIHFVCPSIYPSIHSSNPSILCQIWNEAHGIAWLGSFEEYYSFINDNDNYDGGDDDDDGDGDGDGALVTAENGKNAKPTATDLTWISNLMPDYNSANEHCGDETLVCFIRLNVPPFHLSVSLLLLVVVFCLFTD